jgi:hypothetical protein
MVPLGDLLTTCRIQTGWEMSIEQCPTCPFRCIDNPDFQFGNDSVLTWTRTRSDGAETLLTLYTML